MSHFRRVVKWVINFLTGLLLVILILVVYGKCVLMFTDNKYPNYFGYTLFEVASGSMEPTLYTNDVILVHITKKDLKEKDIIAFNSENAIITHRIIFIDGDTITVKGDNNNTIDMPINKSQVIGKVVKAFPKLGIWKKVITEPKILVAIFVTLLLFDFALSYKSSDEDNDKAKIEKKLDEAFSEEEAPKRDIVESDELLESTRKINIDEINDLLEKQDIILTKKERKQINREMASEGKTEDKDSNKKRSEYTARLDLNEIQRRIKNKLK